MLSMAGWTLERHKRQAELIRQWKPLAKSTGPKSQEGKERVARNSWRGGHRQELRELSTVLPAVWIWCPPNAVVASGASTAGAS